MRVIFIVDGGSTVRPSTLRNLLAVGCARQRYEVLPLRADTYHGPRNDVNSMRKYAMSEAEKALLHYRDVVRCIVVVGLETPSAREPSKTVLIDYGLRRDRNGEWVFKALNPVAGGRRYWASSPSLQPALAETVLELAEFEAASEF